MSSWEAFADVVRKLGDRPTIPPSYVFRGQADDAWALQPLLARLLPSGCTPSRAIDIERRVAKEFRTDAHLHFTGVHSLAAIQDASPLDALAFMRHYGVPTRLLDWTASPYVAAYFAACTEPAKDGCIYVVHPSTVNDGDAPAAPPLETFLPYLVDPQAPNKVVFFFPDMRTDRTSAQQGTFSFNCSALHGHDNAILESCRADLTATSNAVALRWIIPKETKSSFMRHLRLMNVAPHALFPGPDGLGRSLVDLVSLDMLRDT